MKLRIRGDSIRLRLKQSEVREVATGKSIVETTRFPDATFCYRLELVDGDSCATTFSGGTMTIGLPRDAVVAWASGNEVAIKHEQMLADGALTVLVEKDFACLTPGDHRDHDDDADTFPHPDAGSGDGC
ncbi:MAG: hypothetical protein WBN09_07595 [Woeseiaceae bacterium]